MLIRSQNRFCMSSLSHNWRNACFIRSLKKSPKEFKNAWWRLGKTNQKLRVVNWQVEQWHQKNYIQQWNLNERTIRSSDIII